MAQDGFVLPSIVPEQGVNVLDVNTKGKPPADLSPYTDKAAWRVWVTGPDATAATEVAVAVVTYSTLTHKLSLALTGQLPASDDFVNSSWTVVFSPSKESHVAGTGLSFEPAPGPHHTAASNCDPSSAIHFLCVPASGASPDVSFTGTLTAGGGTKPLYQFELLGGLYLEKGLGPRLLDFRPGFTTRTEVNQAASTPLNRTTFDPDSITAGIAFQKLKYLKHPVLDLYGIQFDETLPGGEFSRSDPTSNIVASSSAQFILRSFVFPPHRTYAALYPLIGLEAGRNLNRPREFESVAVDLSHYDAIVRGVGGANATFAQKSKDASVDVWSVTGSYLVRIPAKDEPLVKTLHEVTTVELTTRARQWIEVDGNLSPWSFKYLAITAKYQYGALPPVFNFVDHSFSIGLTLRASQSNKPNAAGPPLSQAFTPNP